MRKARTLGNSRILVVEDEYLIASMLKLLLEEEGAAVVGPVGTVVDACQTIRSDPHIDGALVDINLHGRVTFVVGDMLLDRDVPFVFATGYDRSSIPDRFNHVIWCPKPIRPERVIKALGRAMAA